MVKDFKLTTEIIPFFAPDEASQFILVNPDDGSIRIYEYQVKNNKFYIQMVQEVSTNCSNFLTEMKKSTFHTAISTNRQENLCFFDK